MRIIPVLYLLITALTYNTLACGDHLSTKYYISTKGSDSDPGTFDKPFASLHRAQQAVRELKTKDLTAPVEVIIKPGDYYLDRTLQMTRADSGSLSFPITWRAEQPGSVFIRGAKVIKGWEKYKQGIYKADLTKQGLAGVYFHQLFYKNSPTEGFCKRQILARYPDFDPEHPRTGGFLTTTGYAESMAYEQLIYEKGAIPFDKWRDISQAEIFTVYNLGWLTATTPITYVDPNAGKINFEKIRTHVIEFNRFYIQNVLDALDQPGEWYLDYKKSILYFYPPNGEINRGQVFVPVIDHLVTVDGTIPYNPRPLLYAGNLHDEKPLEEYGTPENIKMDPAEHIIFSGLNFECARQDAIRMSGVKNCEIIKCRISNAGGVGVNIGGLTTSFPEVGNPRVTPATGQPVGAGGSGQILLADQPGINCRVTGCDIWETGCEGIILYGTDNLAQNNHVYDNSIWAKDAPAINLLGERNKATRNTLHDMPRCAIFFKGNDNVIELNDVHHVVLETTDMGAIRAVHRNIYLGGDVIRYNKVTNVPGYGYDVRHKKTYQSPFYTFGIYLDDYTSNAHIYGNIVSGVYRSGIVVHGGGNNLIENNILIDNELYQVEMAPIRPKKGILKHGFKGNYVKRNILISTVENSVPYRYVIPDLNGSHRCYFAENIVYTGQNTPAVIIFGNKAVHWDDWFELKEDVGSILADPGFADLRAGDYRLKSDSPARKLGFKEIPLDKIGCYQSPHRASWPIVPNYDRYREEPVIYRAGDYEPQKDDLKYELEFVGPETKFVIPERRKIEWGLVPTNE